MLYRPSAVDSVTVTFTSWPWGKKEMATLTAWTRKAWLWWCWSGAWWQTWTFFRSKERGGPWHGGRGPRRGGGGGPTCHLENIFSGAYIGISSKACCTVDNLVSALSYMYISLMFILIYRKSGNFHVMKIIHVLNIQIVLFSWIYGTLPTKIF